MYDVLTVLGVANYTKGVVTFTNISISVFESVYLSVTDVQSGVEAQTDLISILYVCPPGYSLVCRSLLHLSLSNFFLFSEI